MKSESVLLGQALGGLIIRSGQGQCEWAQRAEKVRGSFGWNGQERLH